MKRKPIFFTLEEMESVKNTIKIQKEPQTTIEITLKTKKRIETLRA